MSSRVSHSHHGIFIPYTPELVELGNNDFAQDGFLLIGRLFRAGAYIVQSLRNKKLYFVKSLTRVDIPGRETQRHEFTHALPPEVRVSTSEAALVRLVEESYFPKVEFIQFLDVDNHDVFFEFKNGGTLEQFRDKYYDARLRIPEHFIWHVAAELCNALAFMYLGQLRNLERIPNWRMIYHRNIHPSNILLNFIGPRRGRKPLAGNKDNAFPDITLNDFGDSALFGDDPIHLKPGLFAGSNVPGLWEDIYSVGRVLRSLCMTHVDFPADDPADPLNIIPGQLMDESGRWEHRPDSRRLADVNAHPGTPYSQELMELLSRFEFPNQEMESIAVYDNRNLLPDIVWIVDRLLNVARERVSEIKEGNKPVGFFDDLDVSWASHLLPMPFQVAGDRDPILEQVEICIDREPEDYEICKVAYPAPKVRRDT